MPAGSAAVRATEYGIEVVASGTVGALGPRLVARAGTSSDTFVVKPARASVLRGATSAAETIGAANFDEATGASGTWRPTIRAASAGRDGEGLAARWVGNEGRGSTECGAGRVGGDTGGIALKMGAGATVSARAAGDGTAVAVASAGRETGLGHARWAGSARGALEMIG
jgi:hypothetical protein